ncbi:beta-1,4-galactosyltransferase 1 isoform X1 [Phascolarctos cinereus]|uniref:Beta-1,4-galactosyltransferase n=1 Tax=Phascolarctos cinereus TaxID=38626 RepID=A0A6P5IWP0_PHACI|nr:beta-1,4-galactosyltransferase 1 isoform X1 [Phascolarctos cinereus]
MKEPLLGSMAMPGKSLQKACRLLVVFCALHLLVTLFYYLSGRDFDVLQLFSKHQQSQEGRGSVPVTVTEVAREALAASMAAGLEKPAGDPAPQPEEATESMETGPPGKVRPLPSCPDPSPLLVGPLKVEFLRPVNLETIEKENPKLRKGGRFAPEDCTALQKVAIIIPFRNRDEHLRYWLYYLHPFLQRQQLDYGIYVINQDGEETFNRAKLLNVGFQEALKEYDYDCFVFSDVDLIPMDDRNTYRCFEQPRHLSVSMDKFGFSLPYNQYFGGVSALSKEQFLKINGFPNNYWGWGGEDDDIYNRLIYKGMSISRPNAIIGKCRMIRHSRDQKNEPNPQRFDRIAHTRQTMNSDGLNSLKYQLMEIQKYPLYTKITVDIGSPS